MSLVGEMKLGKKGFKIKRAFSWFVSEGFGGSLAAMTYEGAILSGESAWNAGILAFISGMMSGCALDDLISNSDYSLKKLGNQLGKSSDEMADVMGGLKRLAADNNFSSVDDMLDAALNNPARLPAGLHDDIIEAIDGPMGGFNLPKNVDVSCVAGKIDGDLNTNMVNSVRMADETIDGDLLKNANEIKDKLPTWAKKNGNFGYGEVDIEGLDNSQFFAHSSIQTEIPSMKDSGISIKPDSSPFEAQKVNGNNVTNGEGAWLRDVDTEYKILSDIQSKLGDNYSASGHIKLYTELEPCPSCKNVIEQFKQMYPNIDVDVIYSVKK